jgi:hypothetical protein
MRRLVALIMVLLFFPAIAVLYLLHYATPDAEWNKELRDSTRGVPLVIRDPSSVFYLRDVSVECSFPRSEHHEAVIIEPVALESFASPLISPSKTFSFTTNIVGIQSATSSNEPRSLDVRILYTVSILGLWKYRGTTEQRFSSAHTIEGIRWLKDGQS